MLKNPSFYSVIIGTELLNGRREDAHFKFLNDELLKRGWEHKANLVIKDEPKFIEETFKFVKSDKNSVMFSFGGIGATPDDYTRVAAANVFKNGNLIKHQEAFDLIYDRYKEEAYPHRVKMAEIPQDAKLLSNPITNVPGFYLDDRFFFVPGFPQMARPMIIEALDKLYPKNPEKYSCKFLVHASENDLIDIMYQLPKDLEFSSLPKIEGDKRSVEIFIADTDKQKVEKYSKFFKEEMRKKEIKFNTLKEI